MSRFVCFSSQLKWGLHLGFVFHLTHSQQARADQSDETWRFWGHKWGPGQGNPQLPSYYTVSRLDDVHLQLQLELDLLEYRLEHSQTTRTQGNSDPNSNLDVFSRFDLIGECANQSKDDRLSKVKLIILEDPAGACGRTTQTQAQTQALFL
ncbi:hypothetical protein DFH27DRAFT_582838 [Peziza echinospora]|nr:hypothetical protein DFH27DRAFT_582838 [Peziza echinospora]